MGGVPKKRHTKGSRNQRRMHLFAKAPSLVACPKCGKATTQHMVCQNCGYYKSNMVIDVLKKLTKKEKKEKQKEIKEGEKTGAKKLSAEELSNK